MSDVRTFLLEIGTEEIPASYLEPAAKALSNDLKQSLKAKGVSTGEFKTFITPRRIAAMIEGVATKSKEKEEVRQGPPAKIARDKKGNWTEAAKKFAQGQGVDESALFLNKNEKGSYVCVQVKTGGEQTKDALSRMLPNLPSIPFPRSMRWPQAQGVTFARPIRWICCLFGDEVVEFEFAGLKSSNKTYGHRFVHPEAITINNPDEYVQKLRDAFVIVDPVERRNKIVAELGNAADEINAKLRPNEELLEEIVNLVEFPKALTCNLGRLPDLPNEVLTTALAKHQRAFVILEDTGCGLGLMPTQYFVVITNSPQIDPKLSSRWFERMAISRLEDAEFFIQEDFKKGLETFVEEESRVEWIKGIGTLADKTRWLKELGAEIGKKTPNFNHATYERAAYLAKADLLTNLVREKEFTSLQGIAGYYYAKVKENDDVRRVIFEQYGDTPTSLESAVFGIADRLLNIAATFIAGKPPKGSSDPFALRRQAGAIIKIIIDHKLAVDLPAAVNKTLGLIGKEEKNSGEVAGFLADRLKLFLENKGFAYDWVDAVLAVAGDEPYDSWLRLSAFRELDKGEEFRLVAVGQKRVANITRNTRNTPPPDSSLFDQKEESNLWEEANRIRPDLESAVESRDYLKALQTLLSIRPAIDKFFDEVFVMVDDEKLRINRLRLLAKVRDEFLRLADFSRMVVEGGEVA